MSKSIKKREFQIFKIWPNCQAFAFAFCASLKIVNLFSEFVVKFGQMIVNQILKNISLSGRNRQIWRFQDPISSKILNRYSTPLSLRLTLLHVCTNPRPFDCAITRVNRQRTSPSTQRF